MTRRYSVGDVISFKGSYWAINAYSPDKVWVTPLRKKEDGKFDGTGLNQGFAIDEVEQNSTKVEGRYPFYA